MGRKSDPNYLRRIVLNGVWNESGCYEWQGAISSVGYGVVGYKRKQYRVHRLIFILCYPGLADGLMVCHKCSNKLCFNPLHLYAGDARDNARDTTDVGGYNPMRGELNGMSVLKNYQVVAIKRYLNAGWRQCKLADMFEVSKMTISNIATEKGWRSVK